MYLGLPQNVCVTRVSVGHCIPNAQVIEQESFDSPFIKCCWCLLEQRVNLKLQIKGADVQGFRISLSRLRRGYIRLKNIVQRYKKKCVYM